MLDMRTTSISDHLCSVHDECCQATATSSLGKQTKRRIAAGRSHNVDPFHYITFFSIFPCGLLVLLKTNSRMRSTLEHGRRTRSRSRGYRLKLTLSADSIPGSWQWSSTLRRQPQFSGEYEKEFSKEENEDLDATLRFVGSESGSPKMRRPSLLERSGKAGVPADSVTSRMLSIRLLPGPTVDNEVRPSFVEQTEDPGSAPGHPFSFLAMFPRWLVKVTSAPYKTS